MNGPAPSSVRRGALLAALDRGAWLTALVAGPGAGKTSLLAAWAAGRPGVVSLTLRPEHAELPALRAALAEALPALVDGAGPPGALDALRDEPAPGALADPQAYAAGLASVLATAFDRRPASGADPLVLVLDDVHHLPAGSPPARFVEELCRHAPAGLRLLTASRAELPFTVDRLRAAGRCTELDDATLAFADFETYQLLTGVLGDAAAADTLAAQLQALTGGRPGLVALGAAWLAAQPATQRRDRLGALSTTTAELADHLARGVFAAADPAAQELVRRAAYLPRISVELCRALGLPDDTDPSRAVPLLAPVAGAPGWYAVAPGLRTAVVTRHALPPAELAELRETAARWYAGHGHLDDALAIAAGGPTAPLVELLTEHGSALLAAGRAAEVVAAAARVPTAARTPRIDLVEGEARHLRGDAAGALACLERLAEGDGGLAPAVAYRIGLIHQTAGDLAGALSSFARARLTDEADPTDAGLLLSQVATAKWLRGDNEGCREAAGRALELADTGGGDRVRAAAHTALAMAAEREADWPANGAHMTEAMAAATRAGDLNQRIRLLVNGSGRLLEEGRNAAALVQLDEAMRLIEATGAMDRYAVVRTNRGWAYRSMGRLDEAVAELEAGARAWRTAGSDVLAYALTGLGAVYLVRGDLALAEHVLQESWDIGERTGDHQALAGLVTLSRVRYATDPASAWAVAERSIETGLGVWHGWALLSAGWLALCDGDRAAATGYARQAQEAAAARHDASALAELLELRGHLETDGVALLREAQVAWARIGNPIFVARARIALAARGRGDVAHAEGRLRALGVRPEAALAAGPLRAAGAFRQDRPRPFLPAARDGLDRFARGDLGEAQQLLADAVDRVPDPARGGGELRATYLDALRALASASAAAGETDVALRWYLRLLEFDPDDETGHLGVVITLARADRHDEARRRYRTYTDRMRAAGTEPAPYPSEWTSLT